jgi:hypothetical protein
MHVRWLVCFQMFYSYGPAIPAIMAIIIVIIIRIMIACMSV